MGLGYVGLPLAVAFAEEGHDVVGVDVDAAQDRGAQPRRVLHRGHRLRASAGRVARAWTSTTRAAEPLALRRGPRLRPHAADRQPRAGPRSAGLRDARARRPAAARPARRPRVDDLPRHHARAHGADPRGVGPRRRPRLLPGLLARARGSRPHRLHPSQHAEGPRRPHRGLHRPRRGAVPRGLRRDRPRLDPRGRRAHQAAGEHLPLGQHRHGQRDRDAHATGWTSTSGRSSTPPPPSPMASCASSRDRAWAATACRSTPSTSRGVRGSSTCRPSSSSSPARSTSRCPTTASRRSSACSTTRAGRSRASRIACFGVSYKPGVGDLRQSPALKIVALLGGLGADVAYHDPHVPALPDAELQSAAASTRRSRAPTWRSS